MKKKLNNNQLMAILTFLISFVIYFLTMAPTTSFWDCGEFIATSVIMGVPHPPGTPLYLLLGNFFSQIPLFDDIGARVNFISVLVSALAVMFTYLISVQLIEEWRGKAKSITDQIINYGSSFVGAMTFAVTDSHWFNAVEAEVYSISTLFTTIVVWLILKWSKNHNEAGNYRYILMIAYMLGLATGIHLLNLLALPFIALIIYFKNYRQSIEGIIGTIITTALSFLVIYLGIIKGIPSIANTYGWQTPLMMILLIVFATIVSIYNNKHLLSTVLASIVLVLIGFSTYSTIFIRASQEPRINENSPNTLEEALSYMNRDQYGDWSILDRASTIKRAENSYWQRYTNDKSNPTTSETLNFIWNYQIKEMYLRYFAWQFIGKEKFEDRTWELQKLDGTVIKKLQGVDWFRYFLPLAFLFGVAGFGHHFYNDPKRALALLSLFLATGLMIIVYLNQYDPQPRERDYSYVGSFFVFSIWISIGLCGLLERLKEYLNSQISQIKNHNLIYISVLSVLFLSMPFTMMVKDYREHDRTGNYVAWDYAYNLLNSCGPNGILFTNGDNDTFPLWYLQEVENIRKDVRVVNLSLLNTPWYIDQLKNQEPKININLKDEYIEKLDPINGTAFALEQWTDVWDDLHTRLKNYFKEQLRENYSVSEHGIPVEWAPIDANLTFYNQNINFTLNATISNYLKVQDIMVMKILDDLEPDRPVYFAVTVAPSNRIGLEKYLQMEGLVYKVTNQETLGWDNEYPSPRINFNTMEANVKETQDYSNIIKTAEDYISHNQNGIYRYTNLNNPDIYFNNNIVRLVQNYRSGFLQLSLDKLYSTNRDNAKVIELLNSMDTYFPPNIIPISDYQLDIQIGRIYSAAGDQESLKRRLENIKNKKDLDLQTNFYIAQIYVNDLNDFETGIIIYNDMKKLYPSIPDVRYALIEAYAQLNKIQLAINEVDEWLLVNPNDTRALQMKEYLKERL